MGLEAAPEEFFNRLERLYSDTSTMEPQFLVESTCHGPRFAENFEQRDRLDQPFQRALRPSVAVGNVCESDCLMRSELRWIAVPRGTALEARGGGHEQGCAAGRKQIPTRW